MVFKGVRFTVNCTTNDPDALVQLFEKRANENSENSESLKGDRITKVSLIVHPLFKVESVAVH